MDQNAKVYQLRVRLSETERTALVLLTQGGKTPSEAVRELLRQSADLRAQSVHQADHSQ